MTTGHALFSEDRAYRYLLRRKVGLAGGTCLFIMLNPSTADETQDDPTVRRCQGFAQEWGYGTLVVCNLFGLRATDPSMLKVHHDPIGIHWNDYYIDEQARGAHLVVVAWGNHGQLRGRSPKVTERLEAYGIPLYCLGITGASEPRHPLYVSGSQPAVPLRRCLP